MIKLWQHVREIMPMALVVLLCLIVVPVAQANSNGNNNGTTAVQQQSVQQNAAVAVQTEDQKHAKSKAKVAVKPSDKSVLDAEVLASPIAYFKNAFASEEDDSDAAPTSNAVVITVKALIATVLSTIM